MKRDLQLTDGRIVLRPPVPSDAEAIRAAVRESVAEISPWSPWCHAAYSIDDTCCWLATLPEAWARGTDYDFAVFDRRDGTLFGRLRPESVQHDQSLRQPGILDADQPDRPRDLAGRRPAGRTVRL